MSSTCNIDGLSVLWIVKIERMTPKAIEQRVTSRIFSFADGGWRKGKGGIQNHLNEEVVIKSKTHLNEKVDTKIQESSDLLNSEQGIIAWL